jgi:hypothetical protein
MDGKEKGDRRLQEAKKAFGLITPSIATATEDAHRSTNDGHFQVCQVDNNLTTTGVKFSDMQQDK